MVGSLLVIALVGCGRKSPPEPPAAATPILPAPEAALYATGESAPRDSLVFRVVQESSLPWDEALSGAAGSVALDAGRTLDLSWSRWAALRAGYPHPVVAVVEGSEAADRGPVGLGDAIHAQLRMGDHLGLARARSTTGDRWIALVGRPGLLLDPIPRFVEVGVDVPISGDRPARLLIRAPDGTVVEDALPCEVRLDQQGGWWFSLEDPRAPGDRWASFPVFAGERPPPTGGLDLPGDTVVGPDDAAGLAFELIGQLRRHYDLAELDADATLSTLAALPLAQVVAGEWDGEGGEARLQGAGFVGGPVGQAWCRGATVAGCLDDLATRPGGWRTILDPRMRVVGLDAQVDSAGVT
ncbi:MAG: hypothetical protein VX000_06765, partial [Myxococcota bacterium]|nr:hypothetical protein [Myxococcota bacterium]